MAVGESGGHLLDELAGPGLVKPAALLLLQRLVHLPSSRELQD